MRRAGLGLRIARRGARDAQRYLFYDFGRERLFESAELFQDDGRAALEQVIVRPGRWIARERAGGPWIALDPETGARAPIEALRGCQIIDPILADGRVLALRDGVLFCFDLERETFAPLHFADGRERTIAMAGNARSSSAPPTGGRDPIVLRLWIDRRSDFARLDTERLELSLAARPDGQLAYFVATPEPDTLLVIEDERRLVRLRFDGVTREPFFPRVP
jgi:hypothetical protein